MANNTKPTDQKGAVSRRTIPSGTAPTPTVKSPLLPAPPVPPTVAPPAAGTPLDGSPLLEPTPSLLESLGMRIALPKGAILSKPVKGAMPIYTVDDSQSPPRFHMQIQPFVSSLADPSPEAQVADYLASMQRKGANATVLANVPWPNERVGGHLLWTSTDLGEGVVAVQGWLVLQTGPFDFIVASALLAGRGSDEVRPLIEACFRSISLDDLGQIAANRTERLRRGNAILSALTPESLRTLAASQGRLYRVFRRLDGGTEQEIGYYRVSAHAGTMSDASGEGPVRVSENPSGFLVLVQGRTIVDAESGRYADTEGRFWSAFDRGSEAWSSRVTERGGKAPERSFAQTGLRSPQGIGNPRQKLLVINADAQSRTRDEHEWIVPTGIYLSQAETLLLGELLPRDGSCTGDFAYYAFDPRSMQMPQRVETWASAAGGQWMLVTQPGLDEPAEVTLHDEAGRRVRRTEPDGIVTEVCTPDEIQRIWRSKGLPGQ
ncbi:MAG: hypothetical protein EXS03_05080 [Phycisphaerales bacterium]|nr:hypothetical protein [Phycisphaerales bacterium]